MKMIKNQGQLKFGIGQEHNEKWSENIKNALHFSSKHWTSPNMYYYACMEMYNPQPVWVLCYE